MKQFEFNQMYVGTMWKCVAFMVIMTGGDPDIIDGVVKVLGSVALFIEAF